MKVLMLGWDFSPRLSGGVGSACSGLSTALARGGTEVLFVLPRLRGDEQADGVRLVVGEEEARRVALERAEARRNPPPAPQPAPSAATPAREPTVEPRAALPAAALAASTPPADGGGASIGGSVSELPSPAETLRLLTLDSPLRPYLTPEEYAASVRRFLAHIQSGIRGPGPEPASGSKAGPKASSRASPTPPERVRGTPAAERAAAASPAPSATPLAPTPSSTPPPPAPRTAVLNAPRRSPRRAIATEVQAVPPYGTTLVAEVERYARAALAAVGSQEFDVIHAHDWMTFPAGMLLQELSGKPLICHFHSSEFERRGTQAAPEVRAVEQAALQAADRVLCVSHASARALREHHALEVAKLRVLHNAFSPPGQAPRSSQEGGAPTVLYLGRLARQKGPDVFLEAAALVRAHLPGVRFVMSGDGELFPEIVERAEALGLSEALSFTGFLDGEELSRQWADADAYVMPSSAEPFGISALEALSMGVPTIVTREAGVTEVVRSVLKAAPDDVADLADKMVAVLERPALRRTLIEGGLREVAKIRWDGPARRLAGIYDEVVA